MKHFLFYYKKTGRFVVVVSVEDSPFTEDITEAAERKFREWMQIDLTQYQEQFGGFDWEEIKVI